MGADYRDINTDTLSQLAAWVGRGELELCPNGSAFRTAATSAPIKLTPSELKILRTAASVYSKSSLSSQNGQVGSVATENLRQPAPKSSSSSQNGQVGSVTTENLRQPAPVEAQQRWEPDGESKRQEASTELMAALAKTGCFELLERLRSSPSLVMCTAGSGVDR